MESESTLKIWIIMRRIGSMFLAAVLGSVITVATFQWIDDGDEQKVMMNYTSSVPLSKVAYTVDEEGKPVPLDFTVAAEMVLTPPLSVPPSSTTWKAKPLLRLVFRLDVK